MASGSCLMIREADGHEVPILPPPSGLTANTPSPPTLRKTLGSLEKEMESMEGRERHSTLGRKPSWSHLPMSSLQNPRALRRLG